MRALGVTCRRSVAREGAVLALDAAAHGLAVTKRALYEPPFIVDASCRPAPDDYGSS